MAEKMEQSKEFIEELYELSFHDTDAWVLTAMNTILDNGKKFPLLFDLLFKGSPIEDEKNQLTFAKIWAGEIELVEKKPKYVIYQVNENSKTGKVHYTIYAMAEESRFYPRRVNTDRVPDRNASPDELFDQDFAFAMRDTGKFKIEKVVE